MNTLPGSCCLPVLADRGSRSDSEEEPLALRGVGEVSDSDGSGLKVGQEVASVYPLLDSS
jgi:hypothetical protein